MRIETYDLPDFWACALINGDTSGMADEDINAMEAWFGDTFPHGAHCVSVSDDEGNFTRQHDASRYVLACTCQTYTFDVNPQPQAGENNQGPADA